LDTDLVVDLGVGGDDADELLREVIKIYPIDITGIRLSKWFGREGLYPWQVPLLLLKMVAYPIQRWTMGKSPQEILGPGVRVSDLVDSVMAGRWTLREPEEEASGELR
jgi:hypothetical protein